MDSDVLLHCMSMAEHWRCMSIAVRWHSMSMAVHRHCMSMAVRMPETGCRVCLSSRVSGIGCRVFLSVLDSLGRRFGRIQDHECIDSGMEVYRHL